MGAGRWELDGHGVGDWLMGHLLGRL